MDILASLATNKIFIGVAMLMTNLGSRFIIADVGKYHDEILSNALVKKVTVFCMFFIATRDVMTSIMLTFAFVIILDGLLNPKSPFNILFLKKTINTSKAFKVVDEEQ
jgi:hypothetical protein